MKNILVSSIFVIISILLVNAVQAAEISCRDAVVQAYAGLGVTLDPNAFSVDDISNFEMEPEEFNLLSPPEQQQIIVRYTPMSVMVKNTRAVVASEIAYYSNGFFSEFMGAYISKLRVLREKLDTCK